MRRLALLSLFLIAGVARAQGPARLALIDDWRHQRQQLLAVIDSATPEMLSFRPTPGVRSFAEQVQHVASVAARIVGGAVARTPLPPGLAGDSALYMHDKVQLRAMAERHLDFILSSLRGMSEEELAVEQKFAGSSMSRFRWNVTALQHSAWTLGQLVPYLRLNGRTPPQFTPF